MYHNFTTQMRRVVTPINSSYIHLIVNTFMYIMSIRQSDLLLSSSIRRKLCVFLFQYNMCGMYLLFSLTLQHSVKVCTLQQARMTYTTLHSILFRCN